MGEGIRVRTFVVTRDGTFSREEVEGFVNEFGAAVTMKKPPSMLRTTKAASFRACRLSVKRLPTVATFSIWCFPTNATRIPHIRVLRSPCARSERKAAQG